jgi:hypothetical protein
MSLSVHVWKAINVARDKGAFAGQACSAPLWELSKRELIELALRLTMRETPEEAVAAVEVELACLRAQEIV